MVTRKPVNPSVNTVGAASPSTVPPSASALPYPTTPTKEAGSMTADDKGHDASGFDLIDMEDHHKPARRDSDVSSHGTWDSDDPDEEQEGFIEVPKPLNVRASHQDLVAKKEEGTVKQNELPAILIPGHTGGSTVLPRKSAEIHRYDEEAQENPWRMEETDGKAPHDQDMFLEETDGRPPHDQNMFPKHRASAIFDPPDPVMPSIDMPSDPTWHPSDSAHAPLMPFNAPPAPPTSAPPPIPPPPPPPQTAPSTSQSTQAPVEGMAGLSVSGKAPAEVQPTFETAEVLPVPQKGQPPFSPVVPVSSSETPVFPSNNPWRSQSSPDRQQETYFPPPTAAPPTNAPASPTSDSEPHYEPPPGPPPASTEPHYEPPPGPPPGRTGQLIDHVEPQPPPPIVTNQSAVRSSDSVPETPGTRARRQRNEHYQIKHVNWLDKTTLRRSPILTQNANGPCPLLALVNALVLSTPPTLDTALIETLRTREQVSLGLLLDAVFDELMSGRRGETAHELPDVSELYSFLLALHTGMNVNPRFVAKATTSNTSFNGVRRSIDTAGGFEETREMRLYSTFSVPLIHGWIPGQTSPAYAAFERSAQTFEDAQNIQFVGLELEDKSRNEGLSAEEQSSYQDIQTIKQFLGNWPTQLTEYGLEMISSTLRAGEIAILFRNDHFSTLYKEPTHGALMTLVTDAGYGSHEEIVWESLVDVNSAASEMFSGDFRVVSHSEDVRLNQGNSAGGEQGWQTVPSRNRPHQRQTSANSPISPASPITPPLPGPRPTATTGPSTSLTDTQRNASEQEDHDLALALQLQEEEEDRHRQAEARRRREQELSEQFLENEERPPVPPRRSGNNANTTTTSISSPRTNNNNNNNNNTSTSTTSRLSTTRPSGRTAVSRPADASDPDAPPSYEQAASDQPYRPAGSTAPAAQGNPLNAYDALRRQQSAYAATSSTSLNNNPGSAPPYSSVGGESRAGRRRDSNRIVRRRSSGMGGVMMDGSGTGTAGGRVGGAATVRDAEDERCVLM